MTDAPLVSIGVPVYNGEVFLARALSSLLAQTYQHLEIIICDNASTDGTERIARQFAARDSRVRYLRHGVNIGAIPNFLHALGVATGKYFAWNADDDVRPPRSIEECVIALEQHPDAVMAHGPLELDIPKQGTSGVAANRMTLDGPSPARRVRAYTAGLQHVGMMFGLHRREVLSRVRYGNHVAGDYFVCLLTCQRGPVLWVPSPILNYRHQYGALDNPMYQRQPITLFDLLLHRGLRRKKCWTVLAIGAYYLWQQATSERLPQRLRTVSAYASGFMIRFRAELASEIVFLFFTPASWLAVALMPIGRWLKRTSRSVLSVSLR